MSNRRQKTEPVPAWSAFCESLGTRCTFLLAWGERCENGVTKGDRCDEHPREEETLHVIKIAIGAQDFRDMQEHLANGRSGSALVGVRELIMDYGKRSAVKSKRRARSGGAR